MESRLYISQAVLSLEKVLNLGVGFSALGDEVKTHH